MNAWVSWKLAGAGLRRDWGRWVSGVAGVAGAVAILAWHLGLAETAVSQSGAAVERATAPFGAWVAGAEARGPGSGARGAGGQRGSGAAGKSPAFTTEATATRGRRLGGGRMAPVPEAVRSAVAGAPGVEGVAGLEVQPVTLDIRPGGKVRQGPPIRAGVAALPEGGGGEGGGVPFALGNTLVGGGYPALDGSDGGALLESGFLKGEYKPAVGDRLVVVLADRTEELVVSGFFEGTDLIREFPQMYVAGATWKRLFGEGRGANLLLVRMAEGADAAAALGSALEACGAAAAGCRLTTREAVRERFRSDTAAELGRALPLTLTLAGLTAGAMLLTVLGIGLAGERRRIAALRCIGMTRGGVARLMAAEAVAMVVPGWVLGVAAAAGALQAFLAAEGSPELPEVVRMGGATLGWTAALAAGIGALAAAWPCVQAARVRPLEVLGGGEVVGVRKVSAWKTALGVALLAPLPVLGLAPGIGAGSRGVLMGVAGVPAFAVGSLLAMHGLMRLTEALFLRPLGAALALEPKLLARRLSRAPGRALGTVATLSLGLGGFLAVHIWGATLMSAFVPSPEWPDVIVSALPGGFSPEQAAAAMGVEGFARRATEVVASQFPLDEASRREVEARGGSGDGLFLVMGIDVADAWGRDGIAPMRFAAGDREAAARALEAGDACVMPAMVAHALKVGPGDWIALGGRRLEIAGVVDLNWHMVTSRAQVRTRRGRAEEWGSGGGIGGGGRTAGMVFTGARAAKEMVGDDGRVYFFWGNFGGELEKLHPLAATVRLDEQIRRAAGKEAGASIQVHHRDEISDGTLAHGNDILGTMARVPLWSLVVTSTGVAVLLVASARSSRRELATMRALGMTRGQLARLLLGEAALVGLCAVLASVVGGALFGWAFTGLGGAAWNLPVAFAFPVGQAAKGIAFALALIAAMAAVPVWRIARHV